MIQDSDKSHLEKTPQEIRHLDLPVSQKKKAYLAKGLLIVLGVVILLLLLCIGYVTDWTAGLIKDSAVIF